MNKNTFLSLGSGSSGNAYLFHTELGNFLIDAGVGIRRLLQNLASFAIAPQTIQAIFLTHDHIDHVRCADALSKKYNIPIFATEDTWKGYFANPIIRKRTDANLRHTIQKGQSFKLCGVQITPFPVPHDSFDCVGYFLEFDNCSLALLTDVGALTEEIRFRAAQADYLILESNYDLEMLRNGPYPLYLQQRIQNGHGHLSNVQAANLILQNQEHLRAVWLCHISQNNNTPQLAVTTSQKILQMSAECSTECTPTLPIRALPRMTASNIFDL